MLLYFGDFMNVKELYNPEYLKFKSRYEQINNNEKSLLCKDCRYYNGEISIGNFKAYGCKLTNTIIVGTGCDLKNKDFSNEKICYNCKHFLGGNDWGLSCKKDYYKLVGSFDEACKDFCFGDDKCQST